jgi:hypothetical protein
MGYLEGGWDYIGAAYAVTAAAFISYTVSVLLRFRAERARAERDAQRAPEVP